MHFDSAYLKFAKLRLTYVVNRARGVVKKLRKYANDRSIVYSLKYSRFIDKIMILFIRKVGRERENTRNKETHQRAFFHGRFSSRLAISPRRKRWSRHHLSFTRNVTSSSSTFLRWLETRWDKQNLKDELERIFLVAYERDPCLRGKRGQL